MAATYRAVLKEVADGLTPEDIEAMKFSLPFKPAKKSTIKTGFQLIQEMESQDMIDDDDLKQLKHLLEEHDLKKLAKIVKKFEDSQTGKADEIKVAENLETDTGVFSHSNTKPDTQPGIQAPPGSFHGTEYSIPCTSPAPHLIPQQGYPNHNNQQHYPSGNYTPNFSPGTSPQNPPPGMQMVQPPNQYFFPQNSATHPKMAQNGGYPSNYNHGNQVHPPTMQANMVQPIHQQSPQQSHQQVAPMSHHANNTPLQYVTQTRNQNTQPSLPNHQVLNPQANGPQPNIPHASHSHQLEGQRSEESQSDNEEIQEVVPDTPIALLESLNLNGSAGSLKSVEPVSKVPMRGREQDPTAVQADGRAVNQVPASAMNVTQPESAVAVQAASTTVQSSTPTQPASAVSGVRQRLKEAPEYTRWRQDGRKVTSFQKGGYELKIVTEPTFAEHYETGEGCYVLLPWQSEYKIHVGNNQPHRCAVEVNYDGKYAGEFELRSHGKLVIERPPFEEGKFCFVKPESAPSGSGVRIDNPDNGIITANFLPEKTTKPAYLNDLSRGVGMNRLETDDLDECYDDVCEDSYEPVEADSLAFNAPSYSSVQPVNDVQRSIIGGGGGRPGPPPGNDWRTGATALVGHSNQQFQAADDFAVDETKKVEITLRLVGLK